MDDRQEYLIEVLAHSSSGNYEVDPSNLEWFNSDSEVCEVNEGTVKAIKNGTAVLTGRLGDFEKELLIKVQIPQKGILPIINFSDQSCWEVKGTTNLQNLHIVSATENSVSLAYIYTRGTGPTIRISPTADWEDLYAIPDLIKLVFNPNEIELSKVVMAVTPNGQTSSTRIEYTDIERNNDNTFIISAEEIAGRSFNHNDYPFKLSYFTFYLTASAHEVQKEYILDISDFSLIYEDYLSSLISSEKVSSDIISYRNPITNGELYIVTSQQQTRMVRTELFNILGQLLESRTIGSITGEEISIPLSHLEKGTYLLNLYQDQKKDVLKLIIN